MKTLSDNFQLEADFLRKLRISFLKKEGYLDHPKRGVIEWHKDDEVSSIGIESHVDEYHLTSACVISKPMIRIINSVLTTKSFFTEPPVIMAVGATGLCAHYPEAE